MKMRRMMGFLLAIVGFAALSLAKAQTLVGSDDASGTVPSVNTPQELPDAPYKRPSEKMKLHNYLLDTVGLYPIIGAAFVAGINQANNAPPEWGQGAEGYAKRFGSDFGIAGVSTTARYALSEAFKEDTLYYPCSCKGFLPRLSHAMISTFTARRGEDGHRVFSIPDLIAPYAGSMTAVYAWFPDRYNYKDGFRIGNYSLLGYIGGNIAQEFFAHGSHSLLSRMHLNTSQPAPTAGSNP
jgi:hypothetical protein